MKVRTAELSETAEKFSKYRKDERYNLERIDLQLCLVQ